MKTFSFPSGPNSISKEELELAFSKFEKVEIPGSVYRLECNFDEMKSPLLVNELVLDEGICEITMLGSRLVSFNIPSTTKTLRIERYNGVQGIILPKFSACLKDSRSLMER